MTHRARHRLGRPAAIAMLFALTLAAAGRSLAEPPPLAAREAEYKTRFANPFVAAQRGYIDDVIMPHGTRRRLVRALKSLKTKKLENPWKKHANIPL